MSYEIPFNKPFMIGKELYYLAQTVLSGHIAGDGGFSQKCEAMLQAQANGGRVLLTPSCTAALELAAILCDISDGDEVILPSYTFVSTANAFLLRNAVLKFVDVRRDTLNLDETLIEAVVTERTRVIVPVHYAGVSCEMDEIMKVAHRHQLQVIEDAAQGLDARYKGNCLGTIGNFGCYSFHETKNFICGEGGAIRIRDSALAERADIVRNKGTNRVAFFHGETDHYSWREVGSSYTPSDLLAAFLYAQLEAMDIITDKRRILYELYCQQLQPLLNRGLISLPKVPEGCKSNYHMFYILLEDRETRSALIAHLKEHGIQAVFHYVPLHTSPVGKRLGYRRGMLPVTETLSEQLLRLPFYYELSEAELDTVVSQIFRFFAVTH